MSLVETRKGGTRSRRTSVHRELALFMPHQLDWLHDHSPSKIWSKARRVGADFAEAGRFVITRLEGSIVRDCWYTSADESAAREQAEYVAHFCRAANYVAEIVQGVELIDGDDILKFSVTMPEVRGRRPRFVAMASNPKSMRSKGGDVVASEFAFHQFAGELYKAMQPVATWGGHIAIISSHNGAGTLFNSLVEGALRSSDPDRHGEARRGDVPFSLHTTTIDDAIENGLVERINAKEGTRWTAESFREHLRSQCISEDDWREEYLCQPSTAKGAYLGFELLRACTRRETPGVVGSVGELLAVARRRIEQLGGVDAVYAGVDVGRTQHPFVLWLLGARGAMRHTLGVLMLRGASYREMQAAGEALLGCRDELRVRRLCCDATGLGGQMAEAWAHDFRGRVEEIKFTAGVKDELAPLVRRNIEEETVDVPDDEVVLADLNSVRQLETAAGKVRFDAESTADSHADCFWSLGLALHAGDRGRPRMRAVEAVL